MSKAYILIAVMIVLAGCGSSSSTNDTTTASLPEISYVNYAPLNPAASAQDVSQKAITVDDDNAAMGENQSWMLASTKLSAQYITAFLEGLVTENSSGSSMLKSLSSEMSNYVGQKYTGKMGPITLGGASVYVGINFSAFTGCASSGVYTKTPTASSPLSMTVFIGTTTTNVLTNPVLAMCVTSLTSNATAGTVWLKMMNYTAAIAGNAVPASTSFLVNATWNDSTTSGCPFTACRKFTISIYDPNGEYATASNHAPKKASGELYIDTANTNLMYLNYAEQLIAATSFVTTGSLSEITCNRYDATLFNVYTNGTEVAGKFGSYYNGAIATIANGGVTEEGDCGIETDGQTQGEFEEQVIAGFAAGACHTATKLVPTAQCTLAPTYTLATPDASTAEVSTTITYPSNAPTGMVGNDSDGGFGSCTTDQDCHDWASEIAVATTATMGAINVINVQNPVCKQFAAGKYCSRECVGNDIMQGICPVVGEAYTWGGVSGDIACTTATGGDATKSCPTGQTCYCTLPSWY